MKKCIVYGAGRHASFIVDILRKDKFKVLALCDSDPKSLVRNGLITTLSARMRQMNYVGATTRSAW